MDKANIKETLNGNNNEKYITPYLLHKKLSDYTPLNVSGNVSKNLYDKNKVYIEGAGNQNAGNNILVLPNTTYTFSIGKYTYGEVKEFDNSGTQINDLGGSESDKIITFTTSSNAKYITTLFFTGTYNVSLSTIDFTQIQLELGSTATEYEEYYEPTLSIRNSNGVFQEVKINEYTYSTSEQRIGTYCGKPLYSKVITYSNKITTGTVQIPHGIDNIDFVPRCDYGVKWDGKNYPAPVIYSEYTKQLIVNYIGASYIYVKSFGETWDAYTMRITLEYTKTTD